MHSSGSPRKELASTLRWGSSWRTPEFNPRAARNSAPFLLRDSAPPVFVSRWMTAAKPVAIDQKRMTFLPHVLPVVRGTTVRFLNSDGVRHNVFSPEGRYNLGTWRRDGRDHTFSTPGVYTQLCRLHPDMAAFVVVLDTPYFATTDEKGAFQIAGVPAGKYTLVAWSEKAKPVRQAVVVEAARRATIDVVLTK